MHRSPLFYPLTRGGDSEGGGAADLQTDIMRFMAILSLCLVAIFALVQSIPLNPPAPPAEAQVAPTEVQLPPARKTAERPQQIERAAVKDMPAPIEAESRPRAPAHAAVPPPAPDVPQSDEGFSLRFASDAALTRLVARDEVGLYAIGESGALRMSVSSGRYAFWPASMPNRFHEMDAQTVPDTVTVALRRVGSTGQDGALKWGVTLPARMQGELDRILAEQDHGALVIGADGRLRLEQ